MNSSAPSVSSLSRIPTGRKLPGWILLGAAAALAAGLAFWVFSRPGREAPPPAISTASTVSPVDGMRLILIPAGPFSMGSEQGDPDEKPVHTVTLDAFWIDQTEVTTAMYARCVQAKGCKAPRKTASATRPDYYGLQAYADFPMIAVDWDMASLYCAWAGRRLPTEAEWEKAARGADGRTYPWGESAADKSRLNFNRQVGDTTRAGAYAAGGSSPYAVQDMAGNVWEWVNDYYDASYYKISPASNPQGPVDGYARVLRGGSWNDYAYYARAASRSAVEPDNLDAFTFGFRCASSQR